MDRRVAAGLVSLVLVLSACGNGLTSGERAANRLRDAAGACDDKVYDAITAADLGPNLDSGTDRYGTSSFVNVADDGKSIEITQPEGGDAQVEVSVVGTRCLLDELKAPSGIASKMASTTGQMGRQSDTWGDFKVTWSYNGSMPAEFNAVFEFARN